MPKKNNTLKTWKKDKYLTVFSLSKDLKKKYSPREPCFQKLAEQKPKERGQVLIYGKKIDVPRTQKSYLKDYTFSGIKHSSQKELSPELEEFFTWSNTLDVSKNDTGKFNQLFVNWYENGNEYIGPHSDDESELKKKSEILSISLGATRTFRIRCKKTKEIKEDIELKHGDVVVMKPKMQKYWTHEIVKIGGNKGKKVSMRINITLRKFKS